MTAKDPYSDIKSPAFVLEEEKLIKNLTLLKYVQREAEVEIILALKAVAMWPVFPLVRQYLSGATASSLHEARLIYEAMGDKAHVYVPAYNPDELEEIASISQTIIFNSLGEMNRHMMTLRDFNPSLQFGLRVNPGYSEIETDLYNPASSGSRLGLHSLEAIPRGISGLHFHALCENNSYTFERVLQAFENKYGEFLNDLKWVNFGGGHLITHASYDVAHLIQVLREFKSRYPHLKVIMEPGSAVVWETGFLKTTILDVINTPDRKFLMLDISFTAHTPDCLEMPYNPSLQHGEYGTNGPFVYYLGGASCLAGDQIGPYSFEQEMKVGDSLILKDMIHYTMVKTTQFNGVNHPDIGMIDSTGHYKIFRRFNFLDFKSRMG